MTLRQVFMAIALIGIILALCQADFEGRPWQKVTAVGFSSDGTKAFAAGISGRSVNHDMKWFEESVTQSVVMIDPVHDAAPTQVDERYHGSEDMIFPAEPFRFATLSPDGKNLWVEWYYGASAVWDVSGRSAIEKSLVGRPKSRAFVRFSPDGKVMAGSDGWGELAVWDFATNKPFAGIGSLEWPRSSEFSPDGRLLAAGDRHGISVFQISSNGTIALQAKLPQPFDVTAMAFSPDAKRIAAATNVDVRIWDIGTKREVARFAHDRVSSLAYSPDGKTIVCGCGDGLIALAASNGAPVAAHASDLSVSSLAVDPVHNRMLAGDRDGNATLFDLKTLSPMRTYNVLRYNGGPPVLIPLAMLIVWFLVARKMWRSAARLQPTAAYSALHDQMPPLAGIPEQM